MMPTDTPITELQTYVATLGEDYRKDWEGGFDALVEREFAEFSAAGKTPEDFYRESKTLLYHLTFFGEDQWKRPYRQILLETLPPPRRMLDYGCGIGADGLKFAAQGYDISFTDYPSRCTDYLQWRLTERQWSNPIYLADDAPHDFDIVYAFDVLEHSSEPLMLLQEIETYGAVVAVNLLRTVPRVTDDLPHLHYGLDIDMLADYIRTHQVLVERDMDYALYFIYRP